MEEVVRTVPFPDYGGGGKAGIEFRSSTISETDQPVTRRNRRKERPRKKKLNPLIAQIETLSLAPTDLSNGTSNEYPKSVLISDAPQNEQVQGGTTSKKKKRKGKNVAMSSIQNLPSSEISSKTSVSSKNYDINSGMGGTLDVANYPKSKKDHGNSADQALPSIVSIQTQNESSQSSGQSPKRNLNKKKVRTQSQQSYDKAMKQQNAHSSSKQKLSANARSDNILCENKFDDYLQRELVEVMLKEQTNVIKGFIRINVRNFREAYINSPDGSKDILIDGVKNRNRALEGDEVVVYILPESQWKIHDGAAQKVGRVIHILNQVHQRQAVGNLKKMQDGNSRMALFSPRDSRVPRMRIPIKECPKDSIEWENHLFFARITEWEDCRFAKGQLIGDSFGAQGDIEAETRAILLENELECSPYEKRLYQFFPQPPYNITEQDLCGREDLRELCIFTIDPSTAKDLDDAVSCEKLENGNYKVGVHISDVSFFLREGTPLDKEVAKRATTTYLVQRAYHMLPREMTMMCSLLPGEDKLAFSVFWEITPTAEVISHYFTRSVINSCSQLAYEHAQTMIDNPEYEWKDGELPKIYNSWTVEDLKRVVLSLQSLAVIMRDRRFDNGALRVDQTKLCFRLNDDGEPESFSAYVNKESHRLIEEFMLLANMTVATALQDKFPEIAFLRCHDEPQSDMLKKLADLLEKFGIVLETSSAGSLHRSLQRCNSSGDTARFMALSCLCSKPMVRARYFCAATINDVKFMRHYALNAPLYTHFTSPIRRYADVMVHRLLAALLGYTDKPKWTVDYVNNIAATCNKMKFCAKKAGEQSTELFLALWVRNQGPIEEEAVVIDVKDHSFDALVCSTGSIIRVYTDKLAALVEFETVPVPQLKIIWSIAGGRSQPSYQVISIFSVVQVVLRSSSTNNLRLEASLSPPKS